MRFSTVNPFRVDSNYQGAHLWYEASVKRVLKVKPLVAGQQLVQEFYVLKGFTVVLELLVWGACTQ